MVVDIAFTGIYFFTFKFGILDGLLAGLTDWERGESKTPYWLFGISPEGIGTVGMVVNFFVAFFVSNITKEPPQEVQDLVESIRIPKGAGEAHDINA